MRTMLLALVTALAAMISQQAVADEDQDFIFGFRTKDSFETVHLDLKQKRFAAVPHDFFGKTFDRNLPDLVLFAPLDGSPGGDLVLDSKPRKRLFGATAVWVMFFWEERAKPDTIRLPVADTTVLTTGDSRSGTRTIVSTVDSYPFVQGSNVRDILDHHSDRIGSFAGMERSRRIAIGDPKEPESLKVLIEPLAYEPDLGDRSVFGGIASLFKIGGETKDEPKIEDVSAAGEARVLGTTPDGRTRLMLGMVKCRVRDNSVVRIRAVHGPHRAYTTFGNYAASSYGASLATLGAWGGPPDSSGTRKVLVRPFVNFHLYLRRPRLPRTLRVQNGQFPGSISLVAGAEISTDFDHFYGGVAFGHLLGRLGVTGGIPLQRRKVSGGRDRWVGGAAVGLVYAL